ncbi:MAG: site-specific DNA-methyltransferase [Ignavibacteria bacterium]|nr:site-specific DNA-methyltransferase [Ignavibacteria bacterium]
MVKYRSAKNKAPLNRTISVSKKEINTFSREFISLNKKTSLRKIKNKIINQDIFETIEFLPEKFVDLLFIDPPYNISKKFNLVSFKEMEIKKYEQWLDSWLKKIIKILRNTASVYICGDWKSSSAILNTAGKYLTVRNRITWEREKGRGAKRNWKNCSEDIWFFTVSKNYTYNYDAVKIRRKVLAPYKNESGLPKDWMKNKNYNFRDTFSSNTWTDISIPFWSMPENTDHPTQKPEKLLAKIILASSNKGDIVFDPFSGSGTTAVVAKKLGRNFISVDLDKYYCCLAQKRLSIAEKDNRIQGYEDGVFWERNTLREQIKSKKIK